MVGACFALISLVTQNRVGPSRAALSKIDDDECAEGDKRSETKKNDGETTERTGRRNACESDFGR